MSEVFGAYLRGFGRAFQHPVLILLKYLLNLATAALVAAPFAMFLAADLNHSALTDELLNEMTFSYFSEFLNSHGDALRHMPAYWFLLGFSFLALNLYLTGGVLESLRRGRLDWNSFHQACRYRFGYLLTVLLFFLAVAILVFGSIAMLALSSGEPAGWTRWPLRVLLLVVAFVMLAAYDYARIWVCRREPVKAFVLFAPFLWIYETVLAAVQAFFFVFSKPGAWLLALLFLLTQVAVLAAFASFGSGIVGTAYVSVAIAFLWHQALVILRIIVGFGSLAGQTIYLEGRRPSTPAKRQDDRADRGVEDVSPERAAVSPALAAIPDSPAADSPTAGLPTVGPHGATKSEETVAEDADPQADPDAEYRVAGERAADMPDPADDPSPRDEPRTKSD